MGGASMFFHILPEKAVLGDANAHLVRCYADIRENPNEVSAALTVHTNKNSEPYYYRMRDAYNEEKTDSAAQSARFIYLNKACFNGIFRVNSRGQFNVPYGWKEPPAIPSKDQLIAASKALGSATLKCGPYEVTAKAAKSGDFIYLDPPYPPLNGTSYFTHYTADRFGESDQRKLSEWVRSLDEKGCRIMMSNADTPLIRDLYRGFTLSPLSVTRFITCKSVKHRVSELVITNFRPRITGACAC